MDKDHGDRDIAFLDDRIGSGFNYEKTIGDQLNLVAQAANAGKEAFVSNVEILDAFLQLVADEEYRKDIHEWQKRFTVAQNQASRGRPSGLAQADFVSLAYVWSIVRLRLLMRLLYRRMSPPRYVRINLTSQPADEKAESAAETPPEAPMTVAEEMAPMIETPEVPLAETLPEAPIAETKPAGD